jgi:hypothetical protein
MHLAHVRQLLSTIYRDPSSVHTVLEYLEISPPRTPLDVCNYTVTDETHRSFYINLRFTSYG